MSYVERLTPNGIGWAEHGAFHMQRYRYAAPMVFGRSVADIGCGTGFGAKLLADAGADEVTGFDLSKEALEFARTQYNHPRVRYVQWDCQELYPPHGPFDVITAFEIIEHLADPAAMLSNAAKLLTHEGTFLCSTPNRLTSFATPTGEPVNPFHLREYDHNDFSKELLQYFTRVQVLGQELSATYKSLHDELDRIYTNPFIRLGIVLQRLRGRSKLGYLQEDHPSVTEADCSISICDLASCSFLFAICHGVNNSS